MGYDCDLAFVQLNALHKVKYSKEWYLCHLQKCLLHWQFQHSLCQCKRHGAILSCNRIPENELHKYSSYQYLSLKYLCFAVGVPSSARPTGGYVVKVR